MPTNRKLTVPPPPEGFVWAQDYRDHDGRIQRGIASRLGITYSTWRKWRMRGEGPPAVLIGKRLAARIEWIDRFNDQRGDEAVAAHEAAAADAEHSMRPAESRLAPAA
ncbi:hypothetical protein ACFVZH_02410 [Streptomyces sp. NPDC059534]|uniref:hypothetical protein n=1 Tax=Streptomyces sp. NPDC059534 TaxID=3346859 RepID=UPI00367E165A